MIIKKRKIIYVNFAQYDNTGRILDYLRGNFKIVAQFSYDHLRLKNGRKTNFLRIYKNGKLIKEKKLLSIRTPSFLLFPSLPLVALMMIGQSFIYTLQLRQEFGDFDIYFTVNAFSGWIGIVMKQLGLVKKTVFWVWDYFPLQYPDWRIRSARWFYWKFDKPCMQFSDRIIFTNRKLYKLRKETNMINDETKPIIVPVGTNVKKIFFHKKKKIIVGFLGMLKASQGIDMMINSLPELIKKFPKLQLEIIGSGPEEHRFKQKTRKYHKNVTFHGFIENQNDIEKITKRWAIGLALYTPEKSNESYWGDPSKIKVYISNGIPVITTNVSYFASEIKKKKAGIVVPHNKPEIFSQAVQSIIKAQKTYQKNALSLAKKYQYTKIYPKLFEV